MANWISLLFLMSVTLLSTSAFERYSDIIGLSRLETVYERFPNVDEYFFWFFQEDRYNPGTFYCGLSSALYKYDLSAGNFTLLLGDPLVRDYHPGPEALKARFNLIAGIYQYNETRLFIRDFVNGCYRIFDMDTNLVSPFLSVCSSKLKSIQFLQPGEVANNTFAFVGMSDLIYIKQMDYYLIRDMIHIEIFKFDANRNELTIFVSAEKMQANFVAIEYWLLNSDESKLFISHSNGISTIDIETLDIELLVGEIERNAKGVPPNISNGAIGFQTKLTWIVPDLVLAGYSQLNEDVSIIDLKNKQATHLCIGSPNISYTIPGPLEKCQVNTILDIAFTQSNDLYILGMWDKEHEDISVGPGNYSLHKFHLQIAKCERMKPTGRELTSPDASNYTIYTKVKYSCPAGFSLNVPDSTVICVDAENGGANWDKPIPECLDKLLVTSIYPTKGQMAGGSQVSAYGNIPDQGIQILVKSSKNTTEIIEFSKKGNELLFTMPPASTPSQAEIHFQFLRSEATSPPYSKSFPFEYLQNPQLQKSSVPIPNIQSGGVNAELKVSNIQAAKDYSLVADSTKMSCSKMAGDILICPLPAMQDDKSYLVTLIGDSVPVEQNLRVDVLPDPVFVKNVTSSDSTEERSVGDKIILKGEGLNLEALNSQYTVTLHSTSNPAANGTSCQVLISEITDTELPCEIIAVPSYGVPYMIKVQIGNVKADMYSIVVKAPEETISSTEKFELVDVIIPIVVVLVLLFIILAITVVLCERRRKRVKSISDSDLQITTVTISGMNGVYSVHINMDLATKLQGVDIASEQLKISSMEPIGSGNFGIIYLGQLMQKDVITTVAVKSLKDLDAKQETIEKFLEEAVFLQDFHHANVLPTLGVCWPSGKLPQVILPYMANGDLRSLVQNRNLKLSLGDLLHFGMQIACGMSYLATHRFVHRDLAARNCLVSEKYIVKISDFGLSKDVYNKDYYKPTEEGGDPLPVKWMSMESLKTGVFSTQSDVWSYGVVLWELCTRGAEPYADVDMWNMRDYLTAGHRLDCPDLTPHNIHEKMQSCWLEDPKLRPSFNELCEYFSEVLKDTSLLPESGYSYLRDVTKDVKDDYLTTEVKEIEELGNLYSKTQTK